MKKLVFYTTSGCHLCDVASAMLQQLNPEIVSFDAVDISESDELIDRYGTRIPVIGDPSAEKEPVELGWPFDQEQLLSFLETVIWD